MTKARATTQSDRMCWLLLARLLPKTERRLSRAKLIRSVAACVSSASRADMIGVFDEALERCIAEGLIAQSPLSLTQSGREALRVALGARTLPAAKDWRQLRAHLLVELALERPLPRSKKPSDQLAAAILVAHHKLPEAKFSLRAAVDRLAWRALGVETDAPFDAGRVQRHLLRDMVGEDVRVDLKTWRRMLAVRAAGAPRGDADGLRQALLAHWLSDGGATERDAGLPAAAAASANDNATGQRPLLADLAHAVDQTARAPGVARFHDDRAFIGSVWEHMRGRPPVGSMSLSEFKEQLVAAHRAGLLRIMRADLAAAMDPAEVERSEATYMGATFHLVALDAAGAR